MSSIQPVHYDFQISTNGVTSNLYNLVVPGQDSEGNTWTTLAELIQWIQSTPGITVLQYEVTGSQVWQTVGSTTNTPQTTKTTVTTTTPTQTSSVNNSPSSTEPQTVNPTGTVYRLIVATPDSAFASTGGYRYDTGATYAGCSQANSDACQPQQFSSLQDAIDYAYAHGEIPVQVTDSATAWTIIAGTTPVPAALPQSGSLSITDVLIGVGLIVAAKEFL